MKSRIIILVITVLVVAGVAFGCSKTNKAPVADVTTVESSSSESVAEEQNASEEQKAAEEARKAAEEAQKAAEEAAQRAAEQAAAEQAAAEQAAAEQAAAEQAAAEQAAAEQAAAEQAAAEQAAAQQAAQQAAQGNSGGGSMYVDPATIDNSTDYDPPAPVDWSQVPGYNGEDIGEFNIIDLDEVGWESGGGSDVTFR